MNEHFRDYPWERIVFGLIVYGGFVWALGALMSGGVPDSNREVVAGMAGALGSMATMITQSIWKTSMTERQQAAAIQTLATNAAPATEKIYERTVERQPTAATDDASLGRPEQGAGGTGAAGGAAADTRDAAAAAYGTGKAG